MMFSKVCVLGLFLFFTLQASSFANSFALTESLSEHSECKTGSVAYGMGLVDTLKLLMKLNSIPKVAGGSKAFIVTPSKLQKYDVHFEFPLPYEFFSLEVHHRGRIIHCGKGSEANSVMPVEINKADFELHTPTLEEFITKL